jgi:hypothetical protein
MGWNDLEEASTEGMRAGPVPGTHSADGVDLTLIRWMLSLTPAERLGVLQRTVRSLLRLRDGKLGASPPESPIVSGGGHHPRQEQSGE